MLARDFTRLRGQVVAGRAYLVKSEVRSARDCVWLENLRRNLFDLVPLMSAFQQIRPSELAELAGRQEVHVIDVRTPAEFREVRAPMARNVPLDTFDPSSVVGSHELSSDRPIYVLCHSGARAKKACEQLVAAGHSQVVQVEGGTVAWQAAGLPVERGKKTISLERQVRIAAGSLVLLGVLLSMVLHPYAIGLSAFVGAGLVFAGVTDTCGMGMLLSRMPWNQ